MADHSPKWRSVKGQGPVSGRVRGSGKMFSITVKRIFTPCPAPRAEELRTDVAQRRAATGVQRWTASRLRSQNAKAWGVAEGCWAEQGTRQNVLKVVLTKGKAVFSEGGGMPWEGSLRGEGLESQADFRAKLDGGKEKALRRDLGAARGRALTDDKRNDSDDE